MNRTAPLLRYGACLAACCLSAVVWAEPGTGRKPNGKPPKHSTSGPSDRSPGGATGARAAGRTARANPPAPTSRDTAGIGGRPGRWEIELDPGRGPGGLQMRVDLSRSVDMGGWRYHVDRNPSPRDAVPWIVRAEPIGPDKGRFRPQAEWTALAGMHAIPVVKMPDELWRGWFDADLQDVVGIHYHEFVTGDLARVLVTIHKVPADGPDGQPPADHAGVRGTRLEATLMTPVTYHLDQTLVVRREKGQDQVMQDRIDHEQGHAEQSLVALLETLAGPQDADAYRCTGRRSTVAWYWQARKFGRPWEGYRDGRSTMAALRTSITLAPPTRWTKLLPVPPEKLTAADIQRFNDEIVHLDATFAENDRRVQDAFHQRCGAFEQVRRR